jgi:hypothetical protein
MHGWAGFGLSLWKVKDTLVDCGVKQFCALPHHNGRHHFIVLITVIPAFLARKILMELNFLLRTIGW